MTASRVIGQQSNMPQNGVLLWNNQKQPDGIGVDFIYLFFLIIILFENKHKIKISPITTNNRLVFITA